jgi:bidirectional [NiFe] hydrogenase diaphorase subunit
MSKSSLAGDERLSAVDAHVRRTHRDQDQLIQVLHVAQDVYGYLNNDVLRYVAHALRLPPSLVYGVATFYHLFSFDPPGEHVCTVCTGTACFVKGSDDMVARLAAQFDLPVGQTSTDNRLTLRTARCLGSCGLAPVLVLDGAVHGRMDPGSAAAAVQAVLADGGADAEAADGALNEEALEGSRA